MAASKCPVCDWETMEDGRQVRIGGKTVVVCSEECARAVEAEPARYAR